MPLKQDQFAEIVAKLHPDVIALQEVNQTMSACEVDDPENAPFWKPEGAILREDNHGLQIARRLKEKGLNYYWAWLPMKVGYSKYDEGLAIFSLKPILKVKNLLASKIDDYNDFRTRRILAIDNGDGWFVSIHLSWWQDEHEPFASQWQRLLDDFISMSREKGLYLMGDFNDDAAAPGKSCQLVKSSGLWDCYVLAQKRDDGFTVVDAIDGWKDQQAKARRIDQIWMSQPKPVVSSEVIFNGTNGPVISDHFGLFVQTG